jgi:hypothetical protein
MDGETFEETRFVTDHGTVIIRGVGGQSSIWIGLSPWRNCDDEPDIVVKVDPARQRRIAAAIMQMGNNIKDDELHIDEEVEEGKDSTR